ncbi:MAG TPA: hypothetical protein VN924_23655 [Bryobacteraceae bacterium]|nr:hypothetical protein [Bryobacteraceae bacterium]
MVKKIGSILALTALATIIAFTIANRMHAPRASHVVLASYTGQHLTSFFAGLSPVPAYVNGKLYPKDSNSANAPACSKKPSLLSRAATWIGLERVVHAQGGCTTSTCQGCYIKIVSVMCSGTGSCVGTHTEEGSGGPCTGGLYLDGPACGEDGACGCNMAACTQPPATCNCS